MHHHHFVLDGAPLDAPALRAAARGVAAVAVDASAVLGGSWLGDALLIGPAIGRLCHAAGDPLDDAPPPPAALDALRALAATALTIGAACGAPAGAAELERERARRLTSAVTAAGRESLDASPGDADWPEWLLYLLSGAAAVIACCASCVEADDHLAQAAGDLVAAALQALVLFGPSP